MRTVLRHQLSRKPFVTVANEVARDDRLSFAARGLLIAMLSRPTNWAFSADRLAAGSPVEGRKAVLRSLKELETLGYLFRYRERSGNLLRTVTVVSDEPITDWEAALSRESPDNLSPDRSSPDRSSPDSWSVGRESPKGTPDRESPVGTPDSGTPYERQGTKPRTTHSSVHTQDQSTVRRITDSDARASGRVPPRHSGAPGGARAGGRSQTARRKSPWKDLHDRWLADEVNEDEVIEQIGLWVEGYEVGEETMAYAMLTDGYHVKAILNKIEKERSMT